MARSEAAPAANAPTLPASGSTSPRILRKHIKRRESILKAAAQVFAEMGYQRTSLEDIADHLDLTRASLYHYFPSKDALLAACLEFGAEEAINRLAETTEAAAGLSPSERLRRVVKTQLMIITTDSPELSRLFLSPMDWPDNFRTQVRALRERHDEFFRTAIEDGVASGEFSCPDPNVARHCLHGAMNFAPVWLRPKDRDFEATVDELVETALRMFSPIVAKARRPALPKATATKATVAKAAPTKAVRSRAGRAG
jgi:AcrR family transcriptional regulator